MCRDYQIEVKNNDEIVGLSLHINGRWNFIIEDEISYGRGFLEEGIIDKVWEGERLEESFSAPKAEVIKIWSNIEFDLMISKEDSILLEVKGDYEEDSIERVMLHGDGSWETEFYSPKHQRYYVK